MIATVAALWRHPIKGHGREALDTVTLTEGRTMPWDRRWAVAHEMSRADGTEWAPCANFSRGAKTGTLMAISARVDAQSGSVTLTHPDRPDLTFDPEQDQDAFLDWVRPLMPADRAQSARLVRVPGRGMTDTDYPSISLINLGSNDAMTDAMHQDISPLRWRGNIHLSGLDAWAEFDWVGQTLRIGEAELSVREPIKRCLATTANPQTGDRDADTLGTLNTRFGHQDFGVYATVTRSGDIRVGDRVEPV
ncbi:MOSC domain protein [Roseovarius sp. THAF27]|uniref:MOSC domain-containing protein n=1 Tax=Roseovarius sp. THAF27 TaxID=2587850 RepID=UPI0012A78131|nr:MOSC domain-containing protein [Roseovarius sp. THAF27]QFT82782.1 MOSC domain protein [Roseovarius sp. THAF27]